MPRRRVVAKREVLPDPKFSNIGLAKFINVIMKDGKKSVAEKIAYDALDSVAESKSADALVVFQQALENISPMVEVKSRRVGGATYQVPVEVRAEETSEKHKWQREKNKIKKKRLMPSLHPFLVVSTHFVVWAKAFTKTLVQIVASVLCGHLVFRGI